MLAVISSILSMYLIVVEQNLLEVAVDEVTLALNLLCTSF